MNGPPRSHEEIMAEVKAFNSTLTQAGKKPSRGQKSGRPGYRGGICNPGRPATINNGPRSVGGAGTDMIGHHVVSQAPARSRGGAGLPVGSRNSRSTLTGNPWMNTQSSSNPAPATTGGFGASAFGSVSSTPTAHGGFGTAPSPNAASKPSYDELMAELENAKEKLASLTHGDALMTNTPAASIKAAPVTAPQGLGNGAVGVSAGITSLSGSNQAFGLASGPSYTTSMDSVGFPSSNYAHGSSSSPSGTIFTGAGPSSSLKHGLMPPPPVPAESVPQGSNVTGSPVLERKPITTNWGMYGEPVGPDIPGPLRQPSAPAAIQEIAHITGKPYGELTEDGVTLTGPPIKKRDASQQTPDSGAQPSVGPHLMEVAAPNHGMSTFEMDVDTPETKPTPAQSNLEDSMWAGDQWDLPWKKSSAAPAWDASSGPNKAENVPPMGSILQDPRWATSRFGAPAQRAKPLPVSTQAANTSFGQPPSGFSFTNSPSSIATTAGSPWPPSQSSKASSSIRLYASRSAQGGSSNVFDARSFAGHIGNSSVLQPAQTSWNSPMAMSTTSTTEDSPVAVTEAERAARAFAQLAAKPGNKFKDSRWAN